MEKLARKLVIVSNDEYPREVQNGEVTTRYDLSILNWNWSCSDVYMENFSPGKSIINIGRTVEQHHQIVPNLIGFHALTGCDSVPMMFGLGKEKPYQFSTEQ